MDKNSDYQKALIAARNLGISKCIADQDDFERKFLHDVNKLPELAMTVLHEHPNVDSQGRYSRRDNGELEGVGGQFDPGLRRNAKFHFDRERLKCSSRRP